MGTDRVEIMTVGRGLARNPQNSQARFGEPLACSRRFMTKHSTQHAVALSVGEAEVEWVSSVRRGQVAASLLRTRRDPDASVAPSGFDSLRSLRVTVNLSVSLRRGRPPGVPHLCGNTFYVELRLPTKSSLFNSLPQRGRGTARGSPKRACRALWVLATAVDEESRL